MKRFMTTAATALVLSTAAYADSHSAAFNDLTFDPATNLNASELIGMRVYATENEIKTDDTIATDGEKEWDDIGEINEIVLNRDGDVQSIIVGVGGFLGIGEKDVAVNMSELKFVSEDGTDGDFFLVLNSAKADVENAPAYEYSGHGEQNEAATDENVEMSETEQPVADTLAEAEQTVEDTAAEAGQAAENTAAEAEQAAADTMSEMDAERPMLTPPSIEREGYETTKAEELTADELTGARVYGPGDEDIGEISELLVAESGKLDRAVIDVGGFLGIGERPVAVTFEELQIMRESDGGELRVYIDSTQEALEQQPEYEG
ncbi:MULTISPECIES: PRC-barrel domain-containing protein [unclassified Roseovarius]|uniref:PRC-barrel domain-containing protein n=1 Tax=unclassified Roseovarius TaxID=2614913 RepID=UPI0027402E2C|nr:MULTISPECIES: PRC-barrel domain-containing protein [unclassified Roseovarius]